MLKFQHDVLITQDSRSGIIDSWLKLMLATVPKSWFSSRSGSNMEQDSCNGSDHTKTRTVLIGPVLPTKTGHLNMTSLPPTEYLSSDRIMRWSVRRLCRFRPSFTSYLEIYDLINICWVVIENPRISHEISYYFTAIQPILSGLQSWAREVKERLILHKLRTGHVTIQLEHRNIIGANVQPKLWQH